MCSIRFLRTTASTDEARVRNEPQAGPVNPRTGLQFKDYVEMELKTIFAGFAAEFSHIRWNGIRDESIYQAISCIRHLNATTERMVTEIEQFSIDQA